MNNTVGVSSFRANISEFMKLCDVEPIVIQKHNHIYIMMKKEHYIDMVNKIRLPHIVETPPFIATMVQFTQKTC